MDSVTVPASSRRSRTKAAWIAIVLGTFGIHRFYLGQMLQGGVFALFFWTGIPTVLGIVEGVRFLRMTDERFAELYDRSSSSTIASEMQSKDFWTSGWAKTQDESSPPGEGKVAEGAARVRLSHMPDSGETPIMEAEGNGGHVWVFPDKVRIKHFGARGLLSKGFLKGDKEIWIDQIAGMQWRNPGAMWLGHLQFEVIGGASSTKVASQDENAVMFDAARRDAFAEVKRTVERLLRESKSQARGPQVSAPAPEIPDQLRKLAELRDAGIITADEFEAKKAELLSRM